MKEQKPKWANYDASLLLDYIKEHTIFDHVAIGEAIAYAQAALEANAKQIIQDDIAKGMYAHWSRNDISGNGKESAVPAQEPEKCINSDSWNCKYCRKTATCKAIDDPRNYDGTIKPQPAQEPANPLDMPLPCDIRVGHVTIGKGCKLSALVRRMNVLYEMAQREPVKQESKSEYRPIHRDEWEKNVSIMWQCVRKHDCSIPDYELDLMRHILLTAVPPVEVKE